MSAENNEMNAEQKSFFYRFQNRKKIFLLFFLCAQICMCIRLCAEEKDPWQEASMQLHAQSAVVMDAESGRIIFGKNETEQLPVASTTKIMTCILALENGDANSWCSVSQTAAAQPEVKLGIRAGEEYRLKDLLYAMMLESDNDAAVCAAEKIGGSAAAFAAMMNKKAVKIGCRETFFVTANGLDAETAEGYHHSSAGDLALIMRYCILESDRKEEFMEITRTKTHSFSDRAEKRRFSCYNHNAYLDMDEGALCGKTGYTSKAGYCYAGAVRNDGRTVIVVLLACGWPGHKSWKWEDMRRLTKTAFYYYQKIVWDPRELNLPDVPVQNGIIKKVPVKIRGEEAGEKRSWLIGSHEKLGVRIDLPNIAAAPVKRDATAGTVTILAGREVLCTADIQYLCSVPEMDLRYCLRRAAAFWLL